MGCIRSIGTIGIPISGRRATVHAVVGGIAGWSVGRGVLLVGLLGVRGWWLLLLRGRWVLAAGAFPLRGGCQHHL